MKLSTISVSWEEVAAMAVIRICPISHHSRLNATIQQTTSGNRPT